MNSLSTDAFPFTIAYVCELLGVEEARLLTLCKSLGIQPHQDERTGRLFFGNRELDALRKAFDAEKRGEGMNQLPQKIQPGAPSGQKAAYASVPQRATGTSLSRTELSAIVESVSNVKEEILKDLSQLLDDKLSGLDEVVVELIRSKSENDSLREELRRLEENQASMQSELSKFKPAAFGFYRKDG